MHIFYGMCVTPLFILSSRGLLHGVSGWSLHVRTSVETQKTPGSRSHLCRSVLGLRAGFVSMFNKF